MHPTVLTESIAGELRSICGDSNVIFGDPQRLSRYSRDQVAEKHFHVAPEIVVKPGRAAEVQEILRLRIASGYPSHPAAPGRGFLVGRFPFPVASVCLWNGWTRYSR